MTGLPLEQAREGLNPGFWVRGRLRCSYPDAANNSELISVKNSVTPTNSDVTEFCPKSAGRVPEQGKNRVDNREAPEFGPDCGFGFLGGAAGTLFETTTWVLEPSQAPRLPPDRFAPRQVRRQELR